MKRSISQYYVDSSHQISFTDLFYEKWNKFNENKFSQYYVDSSHQISCYELVIWKIK